MSWKKKEKWSHDDVVEYYHGNEIAYKVWGQNMHFGFWKKGDLKKYGLAAQRRASLRLNEKLSEAIGITKDDYVLDVGCGVGGNVVYLAKTFGCKVVGITITPQQIDLAKKNAEAAGLSHLCDFRLMNYMETDFKDGTFDVVMGLESICYADPQDKFIKEVSRILKPDGKFGMADGFSSHETYEGKNKRLMNRWLDGWLVTSMVTPDKWGSLSRGAGFKSTTYTNTTKEAWPTSIIMLCVSLPFLPLHLLEKIIPLRAYPTDALWHQFFAMKKGLWEYGIFTAKK
jgi:tocopherol O-methyltransferase